MGILTPWLLSGLGLLALPVWLHLLRRHKTTPMEFSSLMLFERHTQSSVKHRRLDYILLLIARLLLLALIVFAFAQPFVVRNVAALGADKTLRLVLIDDSVSMGYGDRMARAKEQGLNLLSDVRPGSKWQVGFFSSQLRMHSQITDDGAALRAAVNAASVGTSRSSLGELARALRGFAESNKVPIEVHLVTDVQRSSMPAGFSDLELGAQTSLAVHPVATEEKANWTVESVKAPRRLGDPKKARVAVTLASFAGEAADRRLILACGGKDLATKTVSVAAHSRVQAEFLGLDLPYGLNRCEVRAEPADQLPVDDKYLFAVERSDPKKILLITGPRSERSLIYFQSALESAAENSYSVDVMSAGQARGQTLDKFSFVVLSDAGEIGTELENGLKHYVEAGGSVWVALGPATAARFKVPISGEPIAESRYAARSGERFQSLDTADETHPSIRGTSRWANVRFYQFSVVKPEASRVIARLSDQSPVLLEQTIGEGKLLVFASALDNLSNDFPLHAAFVPFVAQTANYLAGMEDRAAGFFVDSFLDLRQAQSRAATVEVLDPDGKRAMSLEEASKSQSLALPRSGFYEVRRGAGRQELIAVNIDRRESDLSLIPKEALDLWQGKGEGGQAAGAANPENHAKPWSLGRILLWAALAALLVESVIASRTIRMEAA